MPVQEASVLNIKCDNPKCLGNKLDPKDRTGWLFVSSEVYGQPTQQSVFCSSNCVSAASKSTPELITGPAAPEPEPEQTKGKTGK